MHYSLKVVLEIPVIILLKYYVNVYIKMYKKSLGLKDFYNTIPTYSVTRHHVNVPLDELICPWESTVLDSI